MKTFVNATLDGELVFHFLYLKYTNAHCVLKFHSYFDFQVSFLVIAKCHDG